VRLKRRWAVFFSGLLGLDLPEFQGILGAYFGTFIDYLTEQFGEDLGRWSLGLSDSVRTATKSLVAQRINGMLKAVLHLSDWHVGQSFQQSSHVDSGGREEREEVPNTLQKEIDDARLATARADTGSLGELIRVIKTGMDIIRERVKVFSESEGPEVKEIR
jgi:hypothetical protein